MVCMFLGFFKRQAFDLKNKNDSAELCKTLKIQGIPQSQATANPWHKEEENKNVTRTK